MRAQTWRLTLWVSGVCAGFHTGFFVAGGELFQNSEIDIYDTFLWGSGGMTP